MTDSFLITKIQQYFTSKENDRVKSSFWPSENELCSRALFWRWKGEKLTNPIEASRLMIMQSGKKIEEAYVDILEEIGLVTDKQRRIEMEREGVRITGSIDAMIKYNGGEYPLEIKSMYGWHQVNDLKAGRPKESYLKQLAIYIDALRVNFGYLLYIERGTGEIYQFTLNRVKGEKFKAGLVEFELDSLYERWAAIKKEVDLNVLPVPEFEYKPKLTKEFVRSCSKTDISKARTGKKVLSKTWQCAYCGYKSKCLKLQGIQEGYTQEEMTQLHNLTQGYTTW